MGGSAGKKDREWQPNLSDLWEGIKEHSTVNGSVYFLQMLLVLLSVVSQNRACARDS